MPGRLHERVRKRVTADVRIGEKRLKGLIVDLSTDGLFVQMEAATLPARGIEVELDLTESRFGPAMTVRGEVVRRELSSAALGRFAGRGVGLRITEAPPEYHAAILAAFGDAEPASQSAPPPSPPVVSEAEPAAETELGESEGLDFEFEIEVETSEADEGRYPETPARRGSGGTFQSLLSSAGAPASDAEPERGGTVSGGLGASLLGASRPRFDDFGQDPSTGPSSGVPSPASEHELPEAVEESNRAAVDLPVSAEHIDCTDLVTPRAAAPELAPAAAAPESDEKEAKAGQSEEAEQTEAAVSATGPAPLVLPEVGADADRMDVLCVYDRDDLHDIFDELKELGARPQRARLSGPTRFKPGDVAPRIFVISASEALRCELPDDMPGDMVRVAVADSRSEVLGSLVARLGYDFLIRRPVHPELLRRLFLGLLFQGEELRQSERHPAGWPVQLRVGWRAISATLLDLSRGGARLVVGAEVDLLAEVQLRIPRTSRDRGVSLAGRVIRKRKLEEGNWSLALRFDLATSDDDFEKLRSRTDRGAIGPAPAPAQPWRKRLRQSWLALRSSRSTAARRAEPVVPEAAEERVVEERRGMLRAVLEREVLDLDPDTSAPRNVLVGRDMSVGGLRVDPHPSLACGDELTLALFDAAGEPLQLLGRVTRDDGERGVVLEFVEPSADARARLEELVGSLPAIERLDGVAPSPVVFAQIVTDKVEAKGVVEERN